jgi:hypothetical protein
MMRNQKHIVNQILHALNEDITNPAGVLSEVALTSSDVITATDVEGCIYVLKISAANKPSSMSAEVLS